MKNSLVAKNIILASQSPRRKELLQGIGIDFKVKIHPIDEKYPTHLQKNEITEYLVAAKAAAFPIIGPDELVITADTIVWKDKALEKPKSREEAIQMLTNLSGDVHQVYTSFCITTKTSQQIVTDKAEVFVRELTLKEITHYIDTYQPYDKAGGYGIQEWFGLVCIEKIEGSYFTIMGLPTHLLYPYLI